MSVKKEAHKLYTRWCSLALDESVGVEVRRAHFECASDLAAVFGFGRFGLFSYPIPITSIDTDRAIERSRRGARASLRVFARAVENYGKKP